MTNTIASERKRLGMTQADLGEILNRDRSAISRMENNILGLDGETLMELSRVFSCSTDYLLGLTEERVPRT